MKEITFQAKHYTISAYVRDFIRVNWLKKFFVALFILMLTGFSSWSQSITVDGDPGDWEILEASDPAVFNHIEDPFGNGVVDNQFTEGSKDFNIAADLIWADGQTKAKNDIANAAAYLEGTTLYFAGDKTSNNGDAQIGFWFYLNNTAPRVLQTSPTRGGDFFPEHAVGDILVLIDFTGGGKFGTVSSYVWVGPGNGDYGNNNSLDLAGAGNVAQNNLAEYDVPDGWNFISETYDENQFFEGSINLANLEISDACFSRFLVEARSSQELTASLDDFAAGEFNVEPQASVNDITACENDGPFILTATADGGLGTLEYEWRKLPSNDIIGTASTLEVTENGQYSITILGQGVFGGKCPSQPAIATVLLYDNVDAGTDGTDRFCEGDIENGVVNLFEIITGEDAGGSWADTSSSGANITDPTSVDLSGLSDGVYVFTYTVTPTTGSTCPPDSSTATITIDDTVNAGNDGTDRFCEGDEVNGVVNLFDIITGEDAGGSWADTSSSGADLTDPTSVDLSGLSDGVYVFTYTVTPATGSTCPPDSSTTTITIDDTVNAGNDGTDRFCEGDEVNGVVNLFDIITGEDAGGSWADTSSSGANITDPTSVDLSGLSDGVYVFTYTVTPATGSTCPSDSSTATITIDDTVNAGNDGTDRFCEGDEVNGVVNLFDIITGEDAGGSWADTSSSGANITDPTSVDLSGLSDGVYVFTYTVTPATGSTCPPDSSTATITIDDTVNAGNDGTDRFCVGDTENGVVNLFDIITGEDAGGSWADTSSSGANITDPTSVDLSGLSDGVYVFTYTVTPATGSTCPSDSSTATITIDDTVNAGNDGTDRFCEGDEVNGVVNLFDIITGEDAGGSWADTSSSGANITDPTSVDLSGLSDGVYVFTYTVTPATGSTCIPDSSTATITIDDTVNAGNDGTDRFCVGDTENGVVNLFDIITGEDAGGSWADTSSSGADLTDPTSVDLSGLGDGEYVFTYTVTPATGSTCPPDSSTATITIDDTVNAGNDGTDRFCEGDEVNGVVNLFDIITGEDAGGSWADTSSSGANITDPTSVDLSGLSDGVYVFTYTVTPATGSTCIPDSSTATITIDPLPEIPEIETQLADCLGGDGSFIFLGDPQNLYISFDDGETFELYEGAISLPVGPHDFVIKYGEDGCISEPGQVIIETPPATEFTLNAEITQPDCETGLGNVVLRVGDNTEIDTGFFTYRITSGETVYYEEKQTLAGFDLPPGNYVIFGISDNGCDSGRTEISLEEPICEVFEGCTLGYWKNHTNQWSCYSTCTLYSEVFGDDIPSELEGKTLLQVLNLGGGGVYNLGRQSVAALLNICNIDVDYEILTEAELIAYVQDNFNNAGAAGSYLDELNNAGCTLGGSKATTDPFPVNECGAPEDTRPGKGKPAKNSSSVTSGFIASPVPFKENLTIQYDFEYTSNVTIQVYDLRGQLLRSYKDSRVTKGDKTELDVDFRMKANQVYILRVATDRDVFSKSVISAKR